MVCGIFSLFYQRFLPCQISSCFLLYSYFSDSYIQQMRRHHADRNAYGMSAVGNELRDVTRIMVSNIEDVIHRGEALNSKF